MNHTKQDKMNALLVSAQIIQRQCKFAHINIEKFHQDVGFTVVVYDAMNEYVKYHFDTSYSVDELDETFLNMEEMVSIMETYLSQKVERESTKTKDE